MILNLKKFGQFCSRHQSLLVALFTASVSIVSIIYFYNSNQILLYNDARSHMDISRRIIDSLTPGIMQVGSVWLPLYQLLMMPFTQNDFLWRTGLAGTIISATSYVIASVFVFKILSKLTNSTSISIFGLLVFALNPNLLYLQAVPLDEMLAVMSVTVSVYYLFSWSKSDYLPDMILAALFAFIGSLVRYEVWFLLFAQTVYIFIISLKHVDVSNKAKKAEGYAIIFASLALFGIFLWCLYNFLGWGDPLYFLHHPGGHVDQQKQFEIQGLLPTKHNLFLSSFVLMTNILENIGPTFLITTILSLVYLLFRKDSVKSKLYYLISLAPLGFLLMSLFFGITVLFTKIFPLPDTHKVFNVRYGIIAIIPAVIIVSAALSHLRNKLKFKWLIYVLMVIFLSCDTYYFVKTAPVAVIDDGTNGVSAFGQVDESIIASKVNQNCQNGLTLISAGQDEIIMFESRFYMKAFIYEGSGPYWQKALSNPSAVAYCVLMTKNGPISAELSKNPASLANYTAIYTSTYGNTTLYKLGVTVPAIAAQSKSASTINECEYTVASGDSLWKIAENKLGGGKDFVRIVELNKALNSHPSLIHPNDTYQIPCAQNFPS